jgi:hypothetical protein
METMIKTFELQIDVKQNGAVIRLNDEKGCIVRICGIPNEIVFDEDGNVKEFIDISYKQK